MVKPNVDVFVFVDKPWFESTLRELLGLPRSGSTASTHQLIGPLKDMSDPHGLWMTDIRTRALRNDGAEVTLDFMIPWHVILGIGRPSEGSPTVIGFTTENTTVLRPPTE